MNVEQILRYQKPERTYYDIIGCHISSSVDQINREYKIRALKLHPDKNSDSKSVDEFKQLQLAKEILTDASSRREYDFWLSSGINIPFEQFRQRKAQHSMHWAPPRLSRLSINDRNQNLEGQGSDEATRFPESNESSTATAADEQLGSYNNRNNNHNNADTESKIFIKDCNPQAKVDWLGKFRRYEI